MKRTFNSGSFRSCHHPSRAPGTRLERIDIYREFAPPAHLRGSIACFWMRRGAGATVRILPDACSDIVWRAGRGAVLAGPDTGPSFSVTRPGDLIVGARFLPGAAPALGLPLDELRDSRVTLTELGLDPREQLGGDAAPSDAPALVAAAASRLCAAGSRDRSVQAAALRLLDPRQRVDRLADDLGLSERQLRRRCRASVGYGPKTLQRLLRLRVFIRAGEAELARAALAAGFSDQSHLARECRRLPGLPPTALRALG
ncbi:MAG TPA: helix-turn-helix domain-containing protein [Thermoleophilaceae bacterium]